MTLRWTILMLLFAVPLLALLSVQVSPELGRAVSLLALALAGIAAVLWLIGRGRVPPLPDDELAHEVKNRTAAVLLIIENAALVLLLLIASILELGPADVLKLLYGLILLSIWAYGIAVAYMWQSMGR